jgi:hypothetical protein
VTQYYHNLRIEQSIVNLRLGPQYLQFQQTTKHDAHHTSTPPTHPKTHLDSKMQTPILPTSPTSPHSTHQRPRDALAFSPSTSTPTRAKTTQGQLYVRDVRRSNSGDVWLFGISSLFFFRPDPRSFERFADGWVVAEPGERCR